MRIGEVFFKSYYFLLLFLWTILFVPAIYFTYYQIFNGGLNSYIITFSLTWLISVLGFYFAYKIVKRRLIERNEAFNQVREVRGSLEEKIRERTEELYLSKKKLESEIADRKIIEAQLKESEERYRNIIEHSNNLFYSHTPEHILTYVSPQANKFFDCTQEEAKTRWTEFVTDNPINLKGFEITQLAITSGEIQKPYELELITLKGRKLWVEVHEAPVVENGKTVAVVGALIDITSWKLASVTINKNEKKFRELFEEAPDGILHLDKSGFILDCNKRFSHLMGYEIDELIGSHVTDTLANYHKPLFKEKVPELIKTGKLLLEEVHLIKKNKQIIKARRNANAIYDDNGRLSGIIVHTHDITELIHLRDSLIESEKLLIQSQKIAGIGSFNFDVTKETWQGTSVLYDILEIDDTYPKTIESWMSLIHPDDREEMRDVVINGIRKKKHRFELEHRMLLDNKKNVKWVNSIGEFDTDNNGKIIKLTGSLQDITEKHLSDQKIKDSEEQLRAIFDAADNVSFMTTTAEGVDSVILDISAGTERIFGYSKEELIGKPVSILHTPEDISDFDINLDKMKKGFPGFVGEMSFLKKSGTKFHAYHKAFPLKVDENNTLTALAVTIDVTETKEARRDLKKREEQLSTLINASPDIICFKDGEGKWILANDANLKIFNLEGVDYFGKTDKDLASFSEFYREEFINYMKTDEIVWSKKEVCRYDSVLAVSTGEEILFDVIKVPLFNNDGSRKGIVVIGRDISKQKDLENELVKAKKLEAVGLMASRLAHEFKNILQSISGYSHFAQEGLEIDERRYQDIEEVLKAAKRADVVVKNLLKAARKFNLELIKNNIHNIVKQFVNSNRKTFGEKILIEYSYEKGVDQLMINCDSIHLELVILNMCFNAVDAMPEGGKIKIESTISQITDNRTKNYEWVKEDKFFTISIEDNGIGMNQDTLDNLFEPFFTTKPIEQGTGLGLSSAFDIVKSHGGFIEIFSELGKGSKFFIHIPITI